MATWTAYNTTNIALLLTPLTLQKIVIVLTFFTFLLLWRVLSGSSVTL